MRQRSISRKFQFFAITSALFLAACSSAPKHSAVSTDQPRPVAATAGKPATSATNTAPYLPKANSGKGGYYKDDGPGDNPPEGLENTVEPIPTMEAYSRSGNRPYVVFGKTYTPLTDSTTPFVQRGVGSWYGKKFHNQKTSSGELYDMYKITAAHPTLPIPSYARVTNLSNGKQVIVRINDRGPFHSSRIIDLSYTAALKLDYLGKGSTQLEVERLLPDDIERMAENRKNQRPVISNTVIASSVVALTSAATTTPSVAAVPQADPKTAQISMEELLAQQSSKPVEKIGSIRNTASAENVAGDTAMTTNTATNSVAGFYIQFGAYAIRANAEATMSRLKDQAQSRLPSFDIVQQGSLYRLVSGPFASRADASSAIVQTADLGVAKPIVVQR